MSPDNEQDKLNSLIYKAIVPEGLRPKSAEDIEAMLDAIGGEKFHEDKLLRMMRKINGEEPVGIRDENICPQPFSELSAEDRELVAFYREKGKDIPSDIQEKLNEIRKRAQQEEAESEEEE